MQPSLQINFVSDVVCPWCAIGLTALEQAVRNVKNRLEVNIQMHLEPFQLNPDMPAEGQDILEHLTQKYGISVAQAQKNYENIRVRGAELGFEFRAEGRGRTWNTFDCHRLLHWAGELDARHAASGQSSHIQHAMKKAMLRAYFTDGKNPAAREVLQGIVTELALDTTRSAAILDSREFAEQVRARQRFYHAHHIHAVPATIINNRHLISGGQPVAVFEQALQQITADESIRGGT